MKEYPFNGTIEGITGGLIKGVITIPETPIPPEPPNGGNGMSDVDAGAGRASVSYPWLDKFAGYGVIYIDRSGNYWRTINAGFNSVLSIASGTWPPGYRIPNGQVGGGYPPSGSQAQGTEPILLMPPPSGTGRLAFHTEAKVVVTNPDTSRKGSFACALGVAYVNGPSRPMFPYLGAAHDLDINVLRQETIGPGDTRSMTMFRTDFIDIAMDGGAATFPDWPNWQVIPNEQTKMYPAVAIAFKNGGQVALQVGQIYSYGWVS